jgi:hypothetical protein
MEAQAKTETAQRAAEEARESSEQLQPAGIGFGQRDNQWAIFDIYTAPVIFTDVAGKQAETSYKAVFKSNKLVAIMSKRYQLLPNEKALQMADEIAAKIGFQQHKVYYSKDGGYMNATYLNKSNKGFSVDVNENLTTGDNEDEARSGLKNAAVGTESKKLKQDYSFNEGYERKVDEVYFGFSIHNSINGTSGFGAGTRGGISAGYDKWEHRGFGFRLFTLRKACMNGAIVRSNLLEQMIVTRNVRTRVDTKLLEMPKIQANVMHVGGAAEQSSTDKFMKAITESMTYINKHMEALEQLYKRWTRIQMTTDFAERLLFLPDKYLPDTVKIENGKLTDDELYKSVSVWEAFNDVTAKVWHSEKLGIRSKEEMLDKLHSALYPAIQVAATGQPAER